MVEEPEILAAQLKHLKQLVEARSAFVGLSESVAEFLKQEKSVSRLMCAASAATSATSADLEAVDKEAEVSEWLLSPAVAVVHTLLKEKVQKLQAEGEKIMVDRMKPVLAKAEDIAKGKAGGGSWAETVQGESLTAYIHVAKSYHIVSCKRKLLLMSFSFETSLEI